MFTNYSKDRNGTRQNISKLSVDDIVILHEECNRLGWKLGRVIETLPHSSDGLVRSVKVVTTDSGVRRY